MKLAEGDTVAQMLLLYGYINVDTDFEQTPTNKLDILPNLCLTRESNINPSPCLQYIDFINVTFN